VSGSDRASCKVSESDILVLQQILKLAEKIEADFSPHENILSERELLQIVGLLSQFETHDEISYSKLAEMKDHIHPKMGLRSFLNFLVPLERLLHKPKKDSDFLVSSKDQSPDNRQTFPLVLILDHLRSAFNVGGILRLADAVGASMVYLVGYTAGPEHEAVQKTSLGAEKHLDIKSFHKIGDAIEDLRSQNFKIVALETSTQAQDLFSPFDQKSTALWVGNERFGIESGYLNLADEVRSIPMSGIKNSLNVVSSLAVASYEWRRQWLLKI
jgi:tRNA(Leu) C34 or U34 (ribose-2'-O)-methylase TrmL